MYLGSWKIDDLLTFPANTHRFDTGAATDADSAPSYRVYEDETSTPILTGTMALLDSSNTAGFYTEQITLSAANGLEKGKSYTIYISATVNSVTGTMSHTFQIEAEVDANVVSDKTGYSLSSTPPTAAQIRTEMDSNSTQLAAIVADTNELQTDWVNGGRLDLILDSIDSDAAAILADTGTDGVVVAAGSKTGYSLSSAGVQAIWDALTSALTTVGSIGKLLVDNINATVSSRSSHSAADVWAVATRLLTAGTNIVLAKGTGVTGFNDLSTAQVNAEVDTALSDVGLTTTITGRIDAAVSTRATPAQVNAEMVDVVGTDVIPDSVAADGSRPTINQALLMISRFLMEKSVSSTTVTVKKEDGSTQSMTFTLDNGTTPTSITRSG